MEENPQETPENTKSSSHVTRLLRAMGGVVGSLLHPTKYTVINSKTGESEGHFTAEELHRFQERQAAKENTL